MSDRAKLLDKIKALLAKTVENGCTEAEAMAALTKARAMMDAYEITEEDVREVEREEAVSSRSTRHDPWSMRIFLCVSIARFTDTETYKSPTERYHSSVTFVGLQADVEFAEWLLEHLTAFVQRELTSFLVGVGSVPDRNEKRQMIVGFVTGATVRIRKRLDELTEQSRRGRTETGSALVLAKRALIERLLPEDLRPTNPGSRKINVNGYKAGERAGDRATFGRPVGSDGGRIFQIGSK